MFAYCRSHAIKNIQYLQAQTKHARREDKSSQPRMRADATPMDGLTWISDPSPDADQRDYLAAYKSLKKSKAAGERKGAQIGIHVLVGVSPDWVREAGDLHDPANPKNKQLLDAAVAWANSWSNDGCYAARLDLDETGGAVVDVFVAPTAEQQHKSGKSKLVVSVNKRLDELAARHGGRQGRHYSALNDDWSQYAQQHLDPRLQRGKPKAESGKRHVLPDAYRAMMQEAEAKMLAVQERERELLQQQLDLADQRVMLDNTDAELDQREEAVKRQESGFRRMAARMKALIEQLADHIGIGPKETMLKTLMAVEQEAAKLAPAAVDPFRSSPEDAGPKGPGL